MAYLSNTVFDNGLTTLSSCTDFYLCSAEPATYTAATSTLALGRKESPGVSAPGAGTPDGRQVTVPAITNGVVTATGTAIAWALVNRDSNRLDAAGLLDSGQPVAQGNPFSITSFAIRFPAAT